MATQKRFIAKNGLDNNALTIQNVATPVNTTDATTKAYVDLKPDLSSTAPAALGVAAVGVGTTAARADHVHLQPTLATLGAQAAGTYATGTGTASGTNTGDQTTVSGSSGSCTGNAATVTTVTSANLTGAVAPSTSGNVLTSNGSAWTSAASAGGFVTGTRMAFQQTAAPTGWTKDTTAALDNSSMRIVIGTVSSGGSVAFTTAFASQAVSGTNGASGATTLATTQIPSHSHTVPTVYACGSLLGIWSTSFGGAAGGTYTSNVTGGGGSHTHPAATFTGTAINLAVKYYDFIIASKI